MRPAVIRGLGDGPDHIGVTFQGDEPRIVNVLADRVELVAYRHDLEKLSKSPGTDVSLTADPVIDLTANEVLDPRSEQDASGESHEQLPQPLTRPEEQRFSEQPHFHSDERILEQPPHRQSSILSRPSRKGDDEVALDRTDGDSSREETADMLGPKLSAVRGSGLEQNEPRAMTKISDDRVRDNEVFGECIPEDAYVGFLDEYREVPATLHERNGLPRAMDDNCVASPGVRGFDHDEWSIRGNSLANTRDTVDDDWPSQSPSLPESPRLESPEPRESSAEPTYFGPSSRGMLPSAFLGPMAQKSYLARQFIDQELGAVPPCQSSFPHPSLCSERRPLSSRPSSVAAAIAMGAHADNSILDVRIPRLGRRHDEPRFANRLSPVLTQDADPGISEALDDGGVDVARMKMRTVRSIQDPRDQYDQLAQAIALGASISSRKPDSPLGNGKLSKPGHFDGLTGTALTGKLSKTKRRKILISGKLEISKRRSPKKTKRSTKPLGQIDRSRGTVRSIFEPDVTDTPKPDLSSSEEVFDNVGSDSEVEVVNLVREQPTSGWNADRKRGRDSKGEASRRVGLEKHAGNRNRARKWPTRSSNPELGLDGVRTKRQGTVAKRDRLRGGNTVSKDLDTSVACQRLLPDSSRRDRDVVKGKVPGRAAILSTKLRTSSAVVNAGKVTPEGSAVSKADKTISSRNARQLIADVDEATPGCPNAHSMRDLKHRCKSAVCCDSFVARASSQGARLSSENRHGNSRALNVLSANATRAASNSGVPSTELSGDESGDEDSNWQEQIGKARHAADDMPALASTETHLGAQLHETASTVSKRKPLRPRKYCDLGHRSCGAPETYSRVTECLTRTFHACSQAQEYLPAAMGVVNPQPCTADANEAATQFRQFDCICRLQVDVEGGAVQCSVCFHWTHGLCSGLSVEQFDNLQLIYSDMNWRYLCHRCAGRPRISKQLLGCTGRFIAGKLPSVLFAEESRLAILKLLRRNSRSHSPTYPRPADRLTPNKSQFRRCAVRSDLSCHDIEMRQRSVDLVLQGEYVQTSTISFPRVEMAFRYSAGVP
jgi:hypothetical protein